MHTQLLSYVCATPDPVRFQHSCPPSVHENGYILALFDNYLLASDDINALLRFI